MPNPSPWGAAFEAGGNVLSTIALLMQQRENEKREEEEQARARELEDLKRFDLGIRTPDQFINDRLGPGGPRLIDPTLSPVSDVTDPFRTSTLGTDQRGGAGALDILRRLNRPAVRATYDPNRSPSGSMPADGPRGPAVALGPNAIYDPSQSPAVRAARAAAAETAEERRYREQQRKADAAEFDRRQRIQQENAIERIDRTQSAITARSGARASDPNVARNRFVTKRFEHYVTPRTNSYGDVLPNTGLPREEAIRRAQADAAALEKALGGQVPPEWEQELEAMDPEEQQAYFDYLLNEVVMPPVIANPPR